jgi:hypothetical protein
MLLAASAVLMTQGCVPPTDNPNEDTFAGAKVIKSASELPAAGAGNTGELYYVTDEGKFYYSDGSTWVSINLVGATGTGITWKGALSSPPTSPGLNWAYYNVVNHASYIWDGTAWQILCTDGVSAAYRWAAFHTYDPVSGWVMQNDASQFGGIPPSNWTDGSALAYQMSADKTVLRSLFTRRGYATGSANVFCDLWIANSSTDGEVVLVLFRIKNSSPNAVTWIPSFYYTCYSSWGEKASITLNGENSWSALFSGTANVSLSIPANRTSTVIFVSTSGTPASVGSGIYTRSCQLSFYNGCLYLPSGLAFVDDLDTATGGWSE